MEVYITILNLKRLLNRLIGKLHYANIRNIHQLPVWKKLLKN